MMPTTNQDLPRDILPEKMLEDPRSVRVKIIVGAALILMIINFGYMYDSARSATKYGASVEFSDFSASFVYIWDHLEKEAQEAGLGASGVSRQQVASNLIEHISAKNYVDYFSFTAPVVMRVKIGDQTHIVSNHVSREEQ